MSEYLEALWPLLPCGAAAILLVTQGAHQTMEGQVASALGGAYLFFSAFLSGVTHDLAGHSDDLGYDLEWAPYIILDLVMILVFLKYLRRLAAAILWIAVIFQIAAIFVEPHSAPDKWIIEYYDPYFYPAFVLLLVVSLMPAHWVRSSIVATRLRSSSSHRI